MKPTECNLCGLKKGDFYLVDTENGYLQFCSKNCARKFVKDNVDEFISESGW